MATKEKTKLAWWQTLIVVVISAIVALGGVLLAARGYFMLSVSGYYKASEKAFVIPGLNDGFVPQGLHYHEETGKFFVCGYQADGDASPVYIVDQKSGKTEKKISLLQENGKSFTGHAGGIAVHGEFVYIAGSKRIHVFSYDEMIAAENGDEVKSVGTFWVKTTDEDFVGVSFVTATETGLFVGEFHDPAHYPTPASHKLTTKNGDYNQALAVFYEYSDDGAFGLKEAPKAAFSLPDCVQGAAFYDGKAYLSTSWGASFSKIFVYDVEKLVRQEDISLLGGSLPLYAFDSASLEKSLKIAPMSEEIAFVDGKMYVMCESASTKYLFGRLIDGKWCYRTDLEKM